MAVHIDEKLRVMIIAELIPTAIVVTACIFGTSGLTRTQNSCFLGRLNIVFLCETG